MSKLRFQISISLDGFAAGPKQSPDHPLVPTLLGAGERLFDGVESLGALRLERTVAAPGVTHLKFARSRGSAT
ncbi:MAG: hypothetical protein ACREOQ_07025 [Gemmatimonadales bacterium]